MKKSPPSNKFSFFFLNKRLIRNYQIIKTWKAGIVLTGKEVKSILKNNFDLSTSFVFINQQDEVFLVGAQVGDAANQVGKKITRQKLLLHKEEILLLKTKKNQGHFAIIVTKVFYSHHKIKLEIALAKKIKKYNKKAKLLEEALKKKRKKTDFFS